MSNNGYKKGNNGKRNKNRNREGQGDGRKNKEGKLNVESDGSK